LSLPYFFRWVAAGLQEFSQLSAEGLEVPLHIGATF